jgi:hypothetical protein
MYCAINVLWLIINLFKKIKVLRHIAAVADNAEASLTLNVSVL